MVIRACSLLLLLLLAGADAATFITTKKNAPQIENSRPSCKPKDYPDPFCPLGTTETAHWSYTENAGDYTRNCVTHTSCSDT
jgi:hypothetical protein